MASSKIPRNCRVCGIEFLPANPQSTLCSHSCRDEARRKRVTVTCPTCRTAFQVAPWQQRKRKVNYCSPGCFAVSLQKTWPERFWPHVEKTDTCWLWKGQTNNGGYGYIQIDSSGGKKLAHRLSYEIHFGDLPASLKIRHRCDNPPCVNPAHLQIGTQKQNVQDSIERGRWGRRGKLTQSQREEIARRKIQGESAAELATEYKIHPTHVRYIARNFLTHRHL